MSASSSAPINVAFVGYGYTHRVFHLPAILTVPEFNVYAFVQRKEFPIDKRTGEPGPSCVDDYPQAIRYASMEEMLKDEKVELVVVVVSGEQHAALCIQALEAGKNVIVEKPFCMSTSEADAVLAAADKAGKLLSVFQSRRYDSCFRTVNKIVKSGVLGEITSAQVRYDLNNAAWARGNTNTSYTPGQGIMFGIGSHSIDQALELFGPPSHVTGFYRALRGVKSEIDDTYTIILRYDHTHPNLQVTIATELISVMPNQLRYFVRGREGSYVKFGEDPQEEQRTVEGIKIGDPRLGVEEKERWGVLHTKTKVNDNQTLTKELWGGDVWSGKVESEKGSGADYYRDLAKALRGGPLIVDPKQSRDGIRIMELARESYDTGRTLEFQ